MNTSFGCPGGRPRSRGLWARLAASALVFACASGCVTESGAVRAQRALDRGNALRAKLKLGEAASAYTEAVDADPTNLVALRAYVEIRHTIGQTHVAVARFRRAVAAQPSDAYAHEGLGLALFAAGGDRSDESRAELARAADLAPLIADFQYRLGLFFVESERFGDAKDVLAKAVLLDGHNARYRLPYALSLARTGSRAEAIQQLQKVLTLEPTRDEVALAEKTARNLIDPFRGFPQAAREQFEIALNWLDHDSTSQAQDVLESLTQRYPDLAIVHALMGLTAAKMDDASRAISELRKAMDLDPELAEPRLYLGDIYLSRGRPDNAREHYEAAIARNPFLADAYKRLAEVHLRGGDLDGSAEYYRMYLLLRPDDLAALLARAKVLTDGHNPLAGAAWDQAVELYPTRAEVLVPRGRYYFEAAARARDPEARNKARKESARSLEKVIEFDPENSTATALLSELRKLP